MKSIELSFFFFLIKKKKKKKKLLKFKEIIYISFIHFNLHLHRHYLTNTNDLNFH